MSLDLSKDELKQSAKNKRDRKFRLWLTTLSWSTPVMAFGSFFTLWHSLTQAPQSYAKHTVATYRNVQNTAVLSQVGSEGPSVTAIQEQLQTLGYFHHNITEYYGPITEASVSAFQAANNLPQTGKVDRTTLQLLGQAVRQVQVQDHSRSDNDTTTDGSPVLSSANSSQNQNSGSGSVRQSQFSNPVAVTSAS